LLLAGIADRAPGRVDSVEQRGFRNNPPMPDRGQQIILADHPVTVPDQVDKEIEDLGLDSHKGRSPAQFTAIRVERTVLESIAQDPNPLFAHCPPTTVHSAAKEKWKTLSVRRGRLSAPTHDSMLRRR
jgi:hypothetical protein